MFLESKGGRCDGVGEEQEACFENNDGLETNGSLSKPHGDRHAVKTTVSERCCC